jgi:hypothetical protein
MTTKTLRTARFSTVLIAALASLALAAPLAQAARADVQACTHNPAGTTMPSPYAGWVIVNDEQGVPTLYPIGYAPDDLQACAPANVNPPAEVKAPDRTMQSPYPGWVIAVDEQGVPTLYPIGFAPDGR